RVREGMDLPEVDMVHVETVEGPFDLFARAFLVPPVAFRGEKEMPGLPLEPGCDAQLGFAVSRGGVDVVDAIPEQHLEGLVRHPLRDAAERRGAEDDPCAFVTGAAEFSLGDHLPKVSTAEQSGLDALW